MRDAEAVLKMKGTQPCPIWIRLFCTLYDIFFLISLLFIFGFVWVLSLDALSLTEVLPVWVHTFYYLCWVLAYYTYFWHKGQTPAMSIWRLYFINERATDSVSSIHKLSTKQIIIRLSVGILAPLAWITCFFNQDKKSLIDHLCKNQLIRKK